MMDKNETSYLEQKIYNIKPFYNDVKTALCVTSSNEYVPYLYVYLKSVIENSSQKKDIIIFERNISNENKNKITKLCNNIDTSIRFINPSSLFNGINLYVSHDYFKEECYYRIAAPKLLSEYDKIIFTDLDLIVTDDIFKLAEVDMDNHPIAACIEPLWAKLYMENIKVHNIYIRSYTNNILKLSSPFLYYNTGVVVFDVKKYNDLNSFENLLDIINNNKLLYQEQCALNIWFKDNFCTLLNIWNYELSSSIQSLSYKEYEENAKILHFLGKNKPWKTPCEYKSDLWWSYARKTPYYERLVLDVNKFNIKVYSKYKCRIFNLITVLTVRITNNKFKLCVLGITIVKIKYTQDKSRRIVYVLGLPIVVINKNII